MNSVRFTGSSRPTAFLRIARRSGGAFPDPVACLCADDEPLSPAAGDAGAQSELRHAMAQRQLQRLVQPSTSAQRPSVPGSLPRRGGGPRRMGAVAESLCAFKSRPCGVYRFGQRRPATPARRCERKAGCRVDSQADCIAAGLPVEFIFGLHWGCEGSGVAGVRHRSAMGGERHATRQNVYQTVMWRMRSGRV